jgi:hypothetical protein
MRARAVADLAGREAGRLRWSTASGRRPGAEYITIDIAHGHADSVKNMIGYIKAALPRPS